VLIGYLGACSGDDADDGAQRRALVEAGCEQVVVEEQSGAEESGGQPALCGLLVRLRADDVVVVLRLDSLGRSVADVVRRVQRLTTVGAGLRSLAEPLDGIAPQDGTALAAVGTLGARNGPGAPGRTGPGRPAAVGARRRAGGRPPKLSPEQQAAVADEVLSGRRTAARRRAGASASPPHGQAGEDTAPANRIAGVLPLAALDDRLAIVGTSGSGKTYAAKGLAERLMAGGGRLCIVDPLGVWWGLRSAADGHAPSPFPVVVFGGRHADVALDPGMGAALGTLVGTRALACVVDVSDLGSAIARRGFMTAFTAALYEANTEPLHLVLDEADLWAPQRAQPGGHELLGRVEEIVCRGRVRGFVPWLITQRPAVLHKDVLSQADILVSMKLTSSQDREAVGRWIEGQADRAEGRRILGALPRLARGEGWVWAPGDDVLARVAFPRIRTLDSSQTPRRETLAGTPRALAVVDLSALREMLAGMAVGAPEAQTAPAGHEHTSDMKRRLQQRDAELAAARAQLARMEAEAAEMRARLDRADRLNGPATSAGLSVK